MSATDCPTDDDLNAYLADRLAGSGRDMIESHLSRCRHCRRLLASLHEASKPELEVAAAPVWLKARVARPARGREAKTRSPIFGSRPAIAAAAAALVVAISLSVFVFMRSDEQLPADRLRDHERTSAAARLLDPSAGATVAAGRIEFRWSAVEDAQSYTLTLLDEKGDIAHRAPAVGEKLTLSAGDARLERGKSYYWFVTVKLSDGTALDSEIFKFTLDAER